jgi:hypothetical protein
MTTVLIGLTGGRGSGKDTAFGYIHEWAAGRGVRAARRGFADALKLSFARLFLPDCSIDEAVAWCDELKNAPSRSAITAQWSRGWASNDLGSGDTETKIMHRITGRTALQRYGTEGHRGVFGDDFWVDALLPRNPNWPQNFHAPLDFSSEPPEICVVSDVRFENEAQRIRDLGGEIFKIDRDLGTRDGHASEAGLPDRLIDHVINNNSGLPQFESEVRSLMTIEYHMHFVDDSGVVLDDDQEGLS